MKSSPGEITLAELKGLTAGWRQEASDTIWPETPFSGQLTRSFAYCFASSYLCLESLYRTHGIEGRQACGVVKVSAPPEGISLPTHYWAEFTTSDGTAAISDVTIDQSGHPLTWVCDTRSQLAALGLHYVTYDVQQFRDIEPPALSR